MNSSQVSKMLVRAHQAGLVPFIKGSPGIGKTAVIHEFARKYKLKVLDLRLGQSDPTDLLGFPCVENNRASYVPPIDIPIEGDEIPEGYEGWILFLDEMNAAVKAVQAAAYKTIDRMVGQSKIHPRVFIVAAGNLDTDGAIVNTMSSATISRIMHATMVASLVDWTKWAMSAGIDTRIISFVNWKKDLFYKFNPANLREPFPCPRTWHNTSKYIIGYDVSVGDDLESISGIVGSGAAREFLEYCEVFRELHTIEQIMADPTGISVPSEPATRWAMCSHVADNMVPKNADVLMQYITRLPVEFQIIAIQSAFQRDPHLTQVQSVMDWIMKYAADIGSAYLNQ